jgi:hypothetical protein
VSNDKCLYLVIIPSITTITASATAAAAAATTTGDNKKTQAKDISINDAKACQINNPKKVVEASPE